MDSENPNQRKLRTSERLKSKENLKIQNKNKLIEEEEIKNKKNKKKKKKEKENEEINLINSILTTNQTKKNQINQKQKQKQNNQIQNQKQNHQNHNNNNNDSKEIKLQKKQLRELKLKLPQLTRQHQQYLGQQNRRNKKKKSTTTDNLNPTKQTNDSPSNTTTNQKIKISRSERRKNNLEKIIEQEERKLSLSQAMLAHSPRQQLTPYSNNQTIDLTTQTPQLGFIENVDFIKLADSESESHPHQSNRRQSRTDTPNKSAGPRGTKRKFEASTITEEQADAVRKKKGSIITPWFDKVSWKRRNVQQMLTAEIGSFVAYIQPNEEEHQLRQMIIQMVRKLIQSKWPDADVEPFGSFGSKLYLPGGDIDLVILSTQMMSQQKSKILYRLAPLIRENNIGQDVTVIARAKVPIIKFKTIHGNISVDISINQTNGIVSLKKVNELLEDTKLASKQFQSSSSSHRHRDCSHSKRERDAARPPSSSLDVPIHDEESVRRVVEDLGAAKCLILVIKSVLKQRGMNEVYTGGLGSYSIICLVVSFLQLHPKIQRGDIDPNKNLGVLLLEFFELYGKHFNYDQTGISVRKGGYYFSKAHRGWQRERQPYLLSIEDPTDQDNDISSSSHNILSVRTVFSGAFDLLSATLYHRHSLQSSRSGALDKFSSPRPLLSVPVPKQKASEQEEREITKDPMDESLLGEIMGVTKELVEHRKKNVKLFYSGTLQRLLQTSPPRPAGSSEKLPKTHRNEPSLNRRSDDSTRVRDYPSEPDDQSRKRRQENEGGKHDADRKHLSAKDANRQSPAQDPHSTSIQANRVLVRYDDTQIDSPSAPRATGSEKTKKQKKGKKDHKTSPQPLWVEDLEPSDVPILKRTLFASDPQNNQESIVEQTDHSQVDMVDDQDPVVQSGRREELVERNKIRKRDSVGERSTYSNSEGESPAGKMLSNGMNDSEEIDERMDSKYQTLHSSSKAKKSQLTLNFEAEESLLFPSSQPSSGSQILNHSSAKLRHHLTYVEDDDDSESDLSQLLVDDQRNVAAKYPQNFSANADKNHNMIGLNTSVPSRNDSSIKPTNTQQKDQNSTNNNNERNNKGIETQFETKKKEEGEGEEGLDPMGESMLESLPGTPEGSPSSATNNETTDQKKELNLPPPPATPLGLSSPNLNAMVGLLLDLPGTPLSPPPPSPSSTPAPPN